VWFAAGGIGVTAGPALGGLLVSTFGWQSVFPINLPIGVVGIWLTLAFAEQVDPAPWGRGVDLGGRAFGVLFLVPLTGAVIEGGSLGWQAPLVEGGLLLSVVARIGFLTVEMRSQAPMVRLSLFHNSNFSAAMAIGFIISLTMFGLVFLLSLYFSQAGS
jgi:DHA2 family methylenomycin A resistance protein-like MFS transporter